MRRWLLIAFLVGAPALAQPLPEDLQGRRAVRGGPVEGTHESDELKALRSFDEESFPKPGLDAPDAIRDVAAPAIPWLDQLKLPDLPVRLDPRVVRYLEFYRSDKRGRAIMSSWLKAQGRWRPLMEDALRRAKLPLGLIYVSMIESGYDPHDRSSAGAVGLWQFMPEGARIYGLRVDYWIDERKNPEKSTGAVMHYLGDLKARFGGWPLALAAFNAGYGAVLRAMQKYNTNDYWELCKHEDGLPWDTMLYVPKAMAAAVVGENRKLFGYDELPADSPYAFDRVVVPSSLSFASLARAAGASENEIALLNPELRRKRTPPDGNWEARVPRGAGPRFTAAYEAHREMVKPFVVRFGERLDDVARQFGLSTKELRVMNGIDDSAEVRPGLTLVVPSGQSDRRLTNMAPAPADTVIVAVPDKDAAVAGKKRVFYRTLSQDSVEDVAAFFKVKPVELQRWNNLDLDARLCSNLVLQLWVPKDFDSSRAALVDPSLVRVVTTGSDEFFDLVEARRGRARLMYAIKKGDDLQRIGKKFGLTVADLERINRFGEKHTELVVGQKLVVYRTLSPAEKEKAAGKITPGGNIEAREPPEADPVVDLASDEEPVPLHKLPRLGKEPSQKP